MLLLDSVISKSLKNVPYAHDLSCLLYLVSEPGVASRRDLTLRHIAHDLLLPSLASLRLIRFIKMKFKK